MRRLRGAWACRRCARNSRIFRSAASIPEAYAVVKQRLDALAERNRNLISEIESQLSKNLQKNGVVAHVYGRRKKPFSIWTKMERKSVGFEQLSDIFGFRIVLDDVEACYRALGVVHTTWPVVPGRFKDYISTPKQNDYRSIHTTVIGPGNQRVELQIRTEDMDQIAEFGIAAHAFYKDGVGSPTELSEARIQRLCLAAPHRRHPRRKAPTPKSFWSTPSSNCSTTRCSASRRKVG